MIWIRKDWTLKELHWNVFRYYRDLFVRWLFDFKERGSSQRSHQKPIYKKPGTSETLTYDALVAMIENDSLETQFKTFFPKLNEDNW